MNAQHCSRVLAIVGLAGLWLSSAGCAEDLLPSSQAALLAQQKPHSAPEFTGVTTWVNSEPLKLADQKGKVVVVHFWTNGCINCIHNYPHYQAWQKKYLDKENFLMVGIHTPEFDGEKDVDRIKDRAAKHELKFAIAVDNESENWKAWGNRYWPCVYLVDKRGNVRDRWEGELGKPGFKQVTARIDALLAER